MSTYAAISPVAPPRGLSGAEAGCRPTPVRLTRRGRLVATLLLTVLLAGALGSVRVVGHASGTTDGPVATFVTVQSGQTLWQIAGAVAPGEDRRDTVARIIDMNELDGARIARGQRLAVPAG